MSKDQIYGFLTELYEMLTNNKDLELPEDSIFIEALNYIDTNCIINWRERVDAATNDLAQRWIQEEINLETALPKWADAYYEDPELSSVLRKLSSLVYSWKKTLTEAMHKDPSIFSIPPEMLSPDKVALSPSRRGTEEDFKILR